jgi:hypothetical protein
MPHDVIVGEGSPSVRHLCSTAEGGSIEVAEDFERELGWKRGQEVDADKFTDASGDEG